jgi:sucrose synthase
MVDNRVDAETLCTVMTGVFSGNEDFLLRQDLLAVFYKKKLLETLPTSTASRFMRRIQEAFPLDHMVYLMYRPHASARHFLKLDLQNKIAVEIATEEYLDCKDHALKKHPPAIKPLRIDFTCSESNTSQIGDLRNIGNGLASLFSQTATALSAQRHRWLPFFEWLTSYKINGQSVLLNNHSQRTVNQMLHALDRACCILQSEEERIPWHSVAEPLKKLGFEKGWGEKRNQVLENLQLFKVVLEKSDAHMLEQFLSRLPLVANVAILSPHGWFGQKNVLGKPDTGGQVIYILDQVRELEKTLAGQMKACGLRHTPKIIVLTRLIPNAGNTSCNQRRERIHGTKNGYILRIPFRDTGGGIVDDWISRFHVWPYLDRYAAETALELADELQGKPDLVIGNYSDGNAVATLLAEHFDATLCTISHALEKTKYLRSDLHWEELEGDYHFSIHFMSDLLAMKRSDFIITSTYQEIAGTDEAMGQYESYTTFTLPNRYQVVSGSNIRSNRYNVNPPGVEESSYFPYYEFDKRDRRHTKKLKQRIFSKHSDGCYGSFYAAEKPLLFAMSRLDRIKNLSGLVEAYGMNPELQELANLMVAGGTTDIAQSEDTEEKTEIEKIYRLVKAYDLDGRLRWLPSVEKSETGELYRIVADSRGVFVQPALFEGFGLTVLEAMVSGLPTCATMYGGPSEIIEDGVCGFLIDPHDAVSMAQTITRFMHQTAVDTAAWKRVSDAGIRRVLEHFTWSRHCEKLLNMANAFGFCRITATDHESHERRHMWEDLYRRFIREPSEGIPH